MTIIKAAPQFKQGIQLCNIFLKYIPTPFFRRCDKNIFHKYNLWATVEESDLLNDTVLLFSQCTLDERVLIS